ncbi:hypothetical protein GGF46_003851 [Coemansia sp. RSA 552]|nr:hypothetical protein GGF46_003851 [Coemansia sp. RSA 552]
MHVQLISLCVLGLSLSVSALVAPNPVLGGMLGLDGKPENMDRIRSLHGRRVQHDFSDEGEDAKRIRQQRAEEIKAGFLVGWNGYKKYAWGADEVDILAKAPRTTRNGWGVTIVDTLDTLWVMGLKDEFWQARDHVAQIDFSNDGGQLARVFETNIRYVGGLLSAYELSGDSMFLHKAVELTDRLMPAFDTPLGLPWQDVNVTTGRGSSATEGTMYTNLAEVGTLQMEFFRLSQHTRNATYHEAAQRVITSVLARNRVGEPLSNYTIQGLYPIFLDMGSGKFIEQFAYWGGGGDSFYEYLIKTWSLSEYRLKRNLDLWSDSIRALREHAVAKSTDGFTLPVAREGQRIDPIVDMFVSFLPGTLAYASKLVGSDTYFALAETLLEGVYSITDKMPTSLSPVGVRFVRQDAASEYLSYGPEQRAQLDRYGLVLERPSYALRPELIESLFYMYRLTGKTLYADRAWKIWQGIVRNCQVDEGYVGTADVTVDISTSGLRNATRSVESFVYGETFKYLYLMFADQQTISLDEWVFTTEAHPLSKKYAFDGVF